MGEVEFMSASIPNLADEESPEKRSSLRQTTDRWCGVSLTLPSPYYVPRHCLLFGIYGVSYR